MPKDYCFDCYQMLKHQKLLHNLLATCKEPKNSKKINILLPVYTNEYLTFPSTKKKPKC